MYLKHFRTVLVRVPDPLRPGKRAFEERQMACGTTSVTFKDENFEAEDDGWVDVPTECGEHLHGLVYPNGERWLTPAEVGELVTVGAATEEVERTPKAKPKAKTA
jgi:hypothetical protein